MAANTRPLTLGEILDRTVQLYRRNFLLMVGTAAPAAGLVVLISGSAVVFFSSRFLSIANAQQTGRPAPDFTQQSLLLGLAVLLFLLIGGPLLLGIFAMALAALNRAVSEVMEGRATTINASYGYAFRHFWRHVGVLFQQTLFAGIIPYFVFIAIVTIGAILAALSSKSGIGTIVAPILVVALVLLFLAFFAVIVMIWLRVSLAFPVSIAEDAKAWTSLKRSNFLTQGTRGRIFVMFLLVGVLNIVLTLMLSIPLDIAVGLLTPKSVSGQGAPTALITLIQIANLAAGFLVRLFIMPIYSTALVLFYVDQRTRLEGYDIEQLMAEAGWSSLPAAPAPFATQPFATASGPIEAQPAAPAHGPSESPVADHTGPAPEGSGA